MLLLFSFYCADCNLLVSEISGLSYHLYYFDIFLSISFSQALTCFKMLFYVSELVEFNTLTIIVKQCHSFLVILFGCKFLDFAVSTMSDLILESGVMRFRVFIFFM